MGGGRGPDGGHPGPGGGSWLVGGDGGGRGGLGPSGRGGRFPVGSLEVAGGVHCEEGLEYDCGGEGGEEGMR